MTSDQPAADHLTTPRVYYTEGRTRAGDLRERDVLHVPGYDWREVLDVWTDDDADRVRADAEFTHDKALVGNVNNYLTGLGMYVLVSTCARRLPPQRSRTGSPSTGGANW